MAIFGTYLRAGRGSEPVWFRGPKISPKFPVIYGATSIYIYNPKLMMTLKKVAPPLKFIVLILTLSNFDLSFFKLNLSSSWERCCQRKNYSINGLVIAQHLGYSGLRFCRFTTRICASLGLRMKFITFFMSDEEKHSIILICHYFLICPTILSLAPAWGFECWLCSSVM